MDVETLVNLALGAVLVVGGSAGHGHQLWVLWRTRSSVGVSAASLCLNSLSSCLMLLNLLALRGVRWFEGDAEGWALAVHVMAVAQVAVGVFNSPLTVLFHERWWYLGPLTAVEIGAATALAAVAQFAPDWGRAVAEGYGTASVAVAVATWLPQLGLLLLRRDHGVLSLPLVLMELAGAVAATVYQAALNHEHWTTWAPNIAILAQQLLILGLWVAFWWRARRVYEVVEPVPASEGGDVEIEMQSVVYDSEGLDDLGPYEQAAYLPPDDASWLRD